jgi:radical SAM protein with 4Fe4S-binding SPASM domain
MTALQDLKEHNARLAYEDEVAGRAAVRNLPVWVSMITTTACNLRCIMCAQGEGMVPVIPMADDVYRTTVNTLFPTAKTVQLTATGEPLMSPNLPRILADLRRFEVRLEIISNGTLMKERKILHDLVERAGTFTFSIDGARRETYDKIRIGAQFDDVMENIRRFNRLRLAMPRAVRPRLTFNYVLMKSTIAEFPAFIDLAARFRADVVSCFHLLQYMPGSEGESLAGMTPLANHYLRIACERAERHGLVVDRPEFFALSAAERAAFRPPREPLPVPDPKLLRGLDEDAAGAEPGGSDPARWREDYPDLPGHSRCHFLWKKTYIGPHGQIYTCCLANATEVGSIRERPFELIWNGPTYTDMRRRVYTDEPHAQCKGCYVIAKSGSIPTSAWAASGQSATAITKG